MLVIIIICYYKNSQNIFLVLSYFIKYIIKLDFSKIKLLMSQIIIVYIINTV